jgi:hypothetical protein
MMTGLGGRERPVVIESTNIFVEIVVYPQSWRSLISVSNLSGGT